MLRVLTNEELRLRVKGERWRQDIEYDFDILNLCLTRKQTHDELDGSFWIKFLHFANELTQFNFVLVFEVTQ